MSGRSWRAWVVSALRRGGHGREPATGSAPVPSRVRCAARILADGFLAFVAYLTLAPAALPNRDGIQLSHGESRKCYSARVSNDSAGANC